MGQSKSWKEKKPVFGSFCSFTMTQMSSWLPLGGEREDLGIPKLLGQDTVMLSNTTCPNLSKTSMVWRGLAKWFDSAQVIKTDAQGSTLLLPPALGPVGTLLGRGDAEENRQLPHRMEEKEQPSQSSCCFPQTPHHTKEEVAGSPGFLQGTSPAWWQEQTGISSFTLGQQI